MSQLRQLQQEVLAIAVDAAGTAQGLAGFKLKFTQAVGQVSATVGGSAHGVDRALISVFLAAEKQLDSAIQALEQAASEAHKFSQSL